MYDVVYFDCFSGVAGDMMLASMFDAVCLSLSLSLFVVSKTKLNIAGTILD